MKLRRNIASIPLRSGEATWSAITDLLTGPGSMDAEQFAAAASIMAMLLAEEIHADEPLTFVGDSARIVIYCSFGMDALSQGEEIDRFSFNPTEDDWLLYVPCAEGDLDWAQASLKSRAPRIRLHRPGELKLDEESKASSSAFDIDWEALS